MSPKLNVILIGIDTLRADHLGCYGYERATSPNIDALGEASLLFKNCRSHAPHTAPSFMSIMTGRYPTYHGVTINIPTSQKFISRAYGLDPDIPTLAKVLYENGYKTGAFTDGGHLHPRLGFSKGFEYYSTNKKGVFSEQGKSIMKDEIFYWLRENSSDPFFLFFHTYAVHSPWIIPAEYQKLYNSGYRAWLENDIWKRGSDTKNLHGCFIKYVKSTGQEGISQFKALYDGAINYIDDFTGSMINLLSDMKILDNTVIIFTSDHGEEFLEHGRLSHEQLYREHLHVPLLIKAPQFPKPQIIDQLVRSVDIFPTVLDLLGIAPELSNGISLKTAPVKNLGLKAIADSARHGFALEDANYKYIYPRYKKPPDRVDELYNLTGDPEEKTNIALSDLNTAETMLYEFGNELNKIPFPNPRKKLVYFNLEKLNTQHD